MIRIRPRSWGVLLAGLMFAGPAHGLPVILPKPGQVGFSLQGQYGLMLNNGNFGSEFSDGGGLAVRVRYRMRYERALGISFESQSMNARVPPPPDSLFGHTKLSMLLSGVDFYQMFNTDQRTQQMLSLGLGLVQLHYTLQDGETEYPLAGDGLYVALGGGIERFFYRSLAFDFSTRYYAIFENSKANHDFQAALGLIFYASY